MICAYLWAHKLVLPLWGTGTNPQEAPCPCRRPVNMALTCSTAWGEGLFVAVLTVSSPSDGLFKDKQPRDKDARVLEGGRSRRWGELRPDCLASCGLKTSILGTADQDHFRALTVFPSAVVQHMPGRHSLRDPGQQRRPGGHHQERAGPLFRQV